MLRGFEGWEGVVIGEESFWVGMRRIEGVIW